MRGRPYCRNDTFSKKFDFSVIETLVPTFAFRGFAALNRLFPVPSGTQSMRAPHEAQVSPIDISTIASLSCKSVMKPISDSEDLLSISSTLLFFCQMATDYYQSISRTLFSRQHRFITIYIIVYNRQVVFHFHIALTC